MTNRVDFDQYTADYNKLLQERTDFFTKDDGYFARYKVDLVKSKLKTPPRRILEYGCGIGRNISFLQKCFPEAAIVGTDISAASLDIAREDYPGVQFILEDESLSNHDTFDLIFIAGVFHHIPVIERDKVAQKLRQRLSSDGDIFIFEHNPYNPITQRIVSTCPYDDDAVLLRPKELRQRLSGAGFQVKETDYCLFVPPSLPKLIWLERYLARVPLGGQYVLHAKK
ncbi:class I SAM-dependent methyltransferase [Variovorax sp. HJSM1_2]|uniref:class I SAM-dependent methyltransferase n=1 Tax=Variovorax sp. HJSM1_2 TaxID=3366263 RepID=UPI003BC1F0BA